MHLKDLRSGLELLWPKQCESIRFECQDETEQLQSEIEDGHTPPGTHEYRESHNRLEELQSMMEFIETRNISGKQFSGE